VILRAAAALPDDDRQRAVGELRSQLCTMAGAAEATPDWTTLTVTGPVEMVGADDAARYEWSATVTAHGRDDGDFAGDRRPALLDAEALRAPTWRAHPSPGRTSPDS
jgi:hypothetical protein